MLKRYYQTQTTKAHVHQYNRYRTDLLLCEHPQRMKSTTHALLHDIYRTEWFHTLQKRIITKSSRSFV
ncbi:hypothetical protein MKMG_01114 [Methanogenium sp. MK-MG]|nr:hypothetical protein MKMG_01114 [Methanogenium sp. MK-MG]